MTQPILYQGSDQVTIGNGNNLHISHKGKGVLVTPTRKLFLINLFHVPQLSYNLLYVWTLTTNNNVTILFDKNGYRIQDNQTKVILFRALLRMGFTNF